MDDVHVSNKMASRLMKQDVDVLCGSHVCKQETTPKFFAINQAAATFIQTVIDNCPTCADAQIAMRCIREARMWANSAIALDSRNWEDHTS